MLAAHLASETFIIINIIFVIHVKIIAFVDIGQSALTSI